jgi:hypothetical protein
MLKDWPKVYQKLKRKRFSHDDERILFARTEAATPDERMQMNDNCLRLTGCWGWENRRRFYQLRRRLCDSTLPGLWTLRLSNEEMNWLPDMDLNHDKVIQSHLCYRYTIGQTVGGGNVKISQAESRH